MRERPVLLVRSLSKINSYMNTILTKMENCVSRVVVLLGVVVDEGVVVDDAEIQGENRLISNFVTVGNGKQDTSIQQEIY